MSNLSIAHRAAIGIAASLTPMLLMAPVGNAVVARAPKPPLKSVARGDLTGVDSAALAQFLAAANAAHSDAIVVTRNGKLVGSWYSDGKRGKIEAMSATKSVVALAVGRLVATKKIASIDLPVSTWYPEWKTGPKSRITLRHLLNLDAPARQLEG
jgi:CubicO group peptidase (beta-lactamase class C family)